METETTLAVLRVLQIILIALLAAGIVVGLSYVYSIFKREIVLWLEMNKDERKRRKSDDNLFSEWVTAQREWKTNYKPLW